MAVELITAAVDLVGTAANDKPEAQNAPTRSYGSVYVANAPRRAPQTKTKMVRVRG